MDAQRAFFYLNYTRLSIYTMRTSTQRIYNLFFMNLFQNYFRLVSETFSRCDSLVTSRMNWASRLLANFRFICSQFYAFFICKYTKCVYFDTFQCCHCFLIIKTINTVACLEFSTISYLWSRKISLSTYWKLENLLFFNVNTYINQLNWNNG